MDPTRIGVRFVRGTRKRRMDEWNLKKTATRQLFQEVQKAAIFSNQNIKIIKPKFWHCQPSGFPYSLKNTSYESTFYLIALTKQQHQLNAARSSV